MNEKSIRKAYAEYCADNRDYVGSFIVWEPHYKWIVERQIEIDAKYIKEFWGSSYERSENEACRIAAESLMNQEKG